MQQDVLRLQITMDHAMPVRVVERARDGRGDVHRVVHRELLLALEARAQALALDVRHDVEQQTIGLARVEQREQVGMLQVSRDANLTQEPVGAEHDTKLRIEDLERDVALVAEIARQIHGCHPTASNLALELVAAGERRVQLEYYVHAIIALARRRATARRAASRQAWLRTPDAACPARSA